ncbi:unnamed protein product [Calicophoron daubneyi]|uniref:Kinesin motor domain-containing protein n=1 Tax=Calicophoron daubneyi TaxID=300641 RepID=A0AAV2TVZ6_CALDB
MDSSVKVGVRVRPLSEVEINDGCSSCLSYPSESNQIMIGKDKLFAFDFVFDESTSQENIYLKAAQPMVDCVLKGYNATLFAYGQTGSGKTYTMGTCQLRGFSHPENGIVPRIVQELFDRMPSCPFVYSVRVSFLEIYKEDIHDLLSDESTPLPIREENQTIKIPGLTERPVSCFEDVVNLLQSGSAKRSVGGTAMNAHSSRSHAIFTLHFLLQPKHSGSSAVPGAETESDDLPTNEEILTAKLHLVDLAGSERIKKTHAEGDRLKEGININRGLLALGNVISALCEKDAKKRSHIPYRDSRLTRLLQDSLGGNSTTLMLTCVSPADSNMEETLNALRYADRARLIKNKPILNRADPKDAELARLRALVIQLQTRLGKTGGMVIMSPCRPNIGPFGTGLPSAAISNLLEKSEKLEKEKRSLCDELDQALEEASELYKKLFDVESVRDAVFAESDKLKKVLETFMSSGVGASVERKEWEKLEEEIRGIMDNISAIRRAGQAEWARVQLEEAYEECKSVVDSAQLEFSADDNKKGLSTPTDETGDRTDSVTYTSFESDNVGSQLRARRLACKERIQSIEEHLQQKRKLLESLESAANLGENSYAALVEQYESQIHELVARIEGLEKERTDLLSGHPETKISANSREQREARLKAMEQELLQAKRQLTELSRLKKAKENREAECTRLREEIQTLKVSMVRATKQLRDESAAYRRWRAEKDREVRKLEEHERRLKSEMSHMAFAHERQQAVLKRRLEAAAANERRLKELVALHRERRAEREKRQNEFTTNNNKFDFVARVRSWVAADLDLQVSMGEARNNLNQLVDSRRVLCEQLRSAETCLADSENCSEEQRELKTREVAQLTHSIEEQTQRITDLQQKLLDAGERNTHDQGAAGGSTDLIISSRLAQLHNIQEARIALRYLFKEAASSRIAKSACDADLSDVQIQLQTQQEETEDLRRKAAEFSLKLTQSEEKIAELQQKMASIQEDNKQLKKQLQLNVNVKAHEPPQKKNRKPQYVLNASGDARRLSGTPVISRKRPITRQSMQQFGTKKRIDSPTILVPDSVKKESVWDAFDEEYDPLDSSLIDPTWRLSKSTREEKNSQVSNTFIHGNPVRCKCRGPCTNRCSCRRTGRICSSDHCKCLAGRCQNRTIHDSFAVPENTQLHTSDDDQLMKPPSAAPLRQKSRRTKVQSPLSEIQENQPIAEDSSQPHVVMNTTFDLNEGSPEEVNIQQPTVTLLDVGWKSLWPKSRPSYFPSPLARR